MSNAKSKKIAALYVSAVFAAGAVFGVAADRFYSVNAAQAERRITPEEYRQQMAEKLQRELDLTAEQTAQVRSIYDYIGERWYDVRDAMEPEFEAMRKERTEQIMSILTPQQQEKYRAIVEERRKRQEAAKRGSACY
jgi:Spy/CpxP family protein refolding chaperone